MSVKKLERYWLLIFGTVLGVYGIEVGALNTEDDGYFYSVGYAKTKQSSVENAKGNLASRLYSKVKSVSTDTVIRKDWNENINVTETITVSNRVESLVIPFPMVDILSSKIVAGQWYSEIRVSKLELYSAIEAELAKGKQSIDVFLKKHGENKGFSCYWALDVISGIEQKLEGYRSILNTGYEVKDYLNAKSFPSSFSETASRCANQNWIYIKAGNGQACSLALQQEVGLLLGRRYKVVKKPNKNYAIVEVECQEKTLRISGGLKLALIVDIRLFDEMHNLLGKDKYRGNGYSFSRNIIEARDAALEMVSGKIFKTGVFER